MRLFELASLPKKAGVAELKWGEGLPRRVEGLITLPDSEDTQFFPLQKGTQFLVAAFQKGQYASENKTRLYFGGTDERPFLVEMNIDVLLSLKKGEAGFYNAIKPDGAKFYEQEFGTKTIRQGDWFAVPIPLSWKSVHGLLGLFSQNYKAVTKKEKGVHIGGTRHLLVEGQYVTIDYNQRGCVGIGEGILRAPDHEDKMLEGPHALFQTKHIREPMKAD